MAQKPSPGKKMTYREFVEQAIRSLRKPPYKGIHVVYTGFNQAFKTYFDEEPRPIVDQLVAEGFVVVRPVRGGVTLFLASEYGEHADPLAKILAGAQKKGWGKEQ